MRTVRLRDGEEVPALGLGTWRMGERANERTLEVQALRLGLDLGLKLIDTAEMYGEGGAEEVVRDAVAGRRGDVFIVSKVYPHNASWERAVDACERSLKRLATDRIDLYLLHWRGSIPLQETVDAFEKLKKDGKIRYWGVSNFDVADMQELRSLDEGVSCAVNQVVYHLGERRIESDLLSDCRRDILPIMAYSPLGQGGILRDRVLDGIARKYSVTPATIALAWVLRNPSMIAIPKSSNIEHVKANCAAADLVLSNEVLSDLDRAFPPPKGPTPATID